MLPIERPFVFVYWMDAVAGNGWTASDETELESVEMVWSCGWMLRRDRTEVILAADVGEVDDTTNRRMAVPLRMVERIHHSSMDGPILYERYKRARKASPPEAPKEQ